MKFKLFFSSFLLLLLCNTCIAQVNEEAVKYLKANAIPLNTSVTDNLDSFSFFKNVLKDNKIVGIGEATHGTHEFQMMKIELFKYLVQNMGYKLFGIEANFTECRDINNYVLNGTGDPVKAINGMVTWPWRTQEVLSLVEWMAQYNKGKGEKEKIKFYGFDMQMDGKANMEIIKKLKSIDSSYFNIHFRLLQNTHFFKGDYVKLSAGKIDSLKAIYAQLEKYISSKESDFLALYSKEEQAYTMRDIRLLEQCLDADVAFNGKHPGPGPDYMNVRDRYMAENISWILDHEGPESKMLVWAHNAHIRKVNQSIKYLGGHLKEMYKNQYYAIGFDFNKGSFRAVGMGGSKSSGLNVFTVGDAIKGSTGNIFSEVKLPAFFIDIRNAVETNSATKSFFSKKIQQRMIGAPFDLQKETTDYYSNDPLYSQYDGLIFINTTSPTSSLH